MHTDSKIIKKKKHLSLDVRLKNWFEFSAFCLFEAGTLFAWHYLWHSVLFMLRSFILSGEGG